MARKKKNIPKKKQPAKSIKKVKVAKPQKDPLEAVRVGNIRYHATYGYIRDYFKESGEKKSRKEILAEYHRIKHSAKGIPLKGLQASVEGTIESNKKRGLPVPLQFFDWFEFERLLSEYEDFFKRTDTIVMECNFLGLASFEFPYSELHEGYKAAYVQINPVMRKMKKEGALPSSVMQFVLVSESNGTFVWSLGGDGGGLMEDQIDEEEELLQELFEEEQKKTRRKKKRASAKKQTKRGKKVSEAEKRKTITSKIKLEREKQKTIRSKQKLAAEAIKLKKAGFSKKDIFKILGI